MADDPDVPSLLDLEIDHEPVPRQISRLPTASYPTMSYTPNYGQYSGGHGHSHGGHSGGHGGGHGHSHGPVSQAHMQEMQSFLASLSPEQIEELRKRAQSFSQSGAFPPDFLQTLSRGGQPNAHGHSHGNGGSHGHSHGDKPCSHSHGQAQSLPFMPSLHDAEVELLHPLIVAAKQGNVNLVKQQIEVDSADINLTDPDGNSALHWAVLNKTKHHVELARYLIESGASVNLVNTKDSQTPLHWACTTGNTQGVTLLLKNGADPNITDKRGCNSLLFAAQYNHPLLVYYLVKQGVRLDSEDNAGHSALHWASYFGYNSLIRMLIKLGSPVNKRDSQGYTPLHWTAVKQNATGCRTLLSEGADPDARENDGHPPKYLAEKKGYFAIAQLLEDAPVLHNLYTTYSGRRLQKHFWFFAGALSFYIISFFLINYPLWFGLSATLGVHYIGKLLFSKRWPGTQYPNRFWMGMFIAGYWLSTCSYFLYVFSWHTSHHPMEAALFILLNIVGSSLYIYLAQADPGVLRNTVHNNLDTLTAKLDKGDKVPDVCPTCMIAKPLRAKHCQSCNHCVARFDHHCHWLDNCIGVYTFKWFGLFLILAVIGHIFWMKIVIYYVAALPHAPNTIFPLTTNVALMWHSAPLIFFAGLSHIAQLPWEAVSLFNLWYCIKAGLTYNETQNGNRYAYLKSASGYNYNPFDTYSFFSNLKEFISPSIDYFNLYFLQENMNELV